MSAARKPRTPWVRVQLAPLCARCERCSGQLDLDEVLNSSESAPDEDLQRRAGEAEAIALQLWNFAARHRQCGEAPR